MEEAKIKRRTAKAALTRQGKALRKKLSDHRPISETLEALNSVKAAFEDLVVKHEAYTQLIVEDEAFEQEEAWLEEEARVSRLLFGNRNEGGGLC